MKLLSSFERHLDHELSDRLSSGHMPGLDHSALDGLDLKMVSKKLTADKAHFADYRIKAIIKAHHRPSLLVSNSQFEPAVSHIWSQLLEERRSNLERTLPAVGRIEVQNHPELPWVGTGFLVAQDIIVTNRHVAQEFVMHHDQGFTWRTFSGVEANPKMDFQAEYESGVSADFSIVGILHVEDDTGPDMALFRVESQDREPLELADTSAPDDAVATIGHPGKETGLAPETQAAMDNIFQGIFNVKRLAPGKITEANSSVIKHDCSTLSGNSGSAIVDIETGKAVALHYRGGAFANFAVPAEMIQARLDGLRS